MNQFDQWNREWLLFNRNSRRAILIFTLLFAISIGVIKLYFIFSHSSEPLEVEITTIEKSIIRELEERTESKKRKYKQRAKTYRYKIPSSMFDPNEYTSRDWQNLGFSSKQAKAIMNYQASGFEFKVKKDMLKLFVVDDEYYSRIREKIDLPDSLVYKNEYTQLVKKPYKPIVVSLNSANIKELVALKGIGDYYASNIIKYRELLGGYFKIDQLKEVYHLPDSIVDHLSDLFTIDTTLLDRYNINKIKKGELNKHPYISYKLANSIIAYRNTHGNYNSVDELEKLILMDVETLEKVRPYLSVE